MSTVDVKLFRFPHSVCPSAPGSVMVDPSRPAEVKIIDPEFTAFAPPGLDAGSLLSGFVLAYLYQELGVAGGGAPLLEAMSAIWQSYAAQLKAEGLSAAELRRVEEDTVGFCLIEVLRTSLGFAGARDPAKRIASPDALERYQLGAVQVVSTCMKGRRGEDGGLPLLLKQLEQLQLAKL